MLNLYTNEWIVLEKPRSYENSKYRMYSYVDFNDVPTQEKWWVTDYKEPLPQPPRPLPLLHEIKAIDDGWFGRYMCGLPVLYKRFEHYTIIHTFAHDQFNVRWIKNGGVWREIPAPNYVVIHKWLIDNTGDVRVVKVFNFTIYEDNFKMIGEGRSYGLDIIRPSSTIMFKSFRTVIKTLPFIQTEKYSFVDFVIDENNVILPGSHHRSDVFDLTSVNYLVDESRPINKCEDVAEIGFKYVNRDSEEGWVSYKDLDLVVYEAPILDLVKTWEEEENENEYLDFSEVNFENILSDTSHFKGYYMSIFMKKFMESLSTKVESSEDLLELLKSYDQLVEVKDTLENINLYKGFVSDYIPYNYPIIGEFLEKLVKVENWEGLTAYQKVNVYRWTINIILLELYTICNKVLYNIKSVQFNKELVEFIRSNFQTFKIWCHSRLDNGLKQHLTRGRISITNEVYTGFDTEYVPLDFGKNKLVSAQLSITGCLKIKVPLNRTFIFEGVSTLTSERYFKETPRFDSVGSILNYINKLIIKNRVFMFQEHDLHLNSIMNKFFSNKNSFEDIKSLDGSIIFKTNKLKIRNVLITSPAGEELKINFDVLTKIVNERIYNDLKIIEDEIIHMIQSTKTCRGSIIKGKDDFKSLSWNNENMKNGAVEHLVLSEKMNSDYCRLSSLFSGEILDNWKDMCFAEKAKILSFIKKVLSDDKLYNSCVFGRAGKKLNMQDILDIDVVDSHSPKNIEKMDQKIKEFLSMNTSIKNSFTSSLFSSTIKNYLLAHFNAADLSMLNDWTEKSYRNIDILKKSFTSLTKSINSLGIPVYVRDTLLLSSAAAGTLDKIGKSYKIPKVSLPEGYISKMDILLSENPKLFEEYAMTDSLITLLHGLFMNDFAFNLGNLRLPNTLGSLSVTYVKNKWGSDNYKGYQLNAQYPLGDLQTSLVPRGVNALGLIGETLPMFTGSYRGGRNECFSYGMDKSTRWYDYDLTSCYSTIMSMCGDPQYEEQEEQLSPVLTDLLTNVKTPDYNKAQFITKGKGLDFKNAYSAVKVQFNLPATIKYPPIPVQLDKNITIYPLQGESLITGLEYKSAINILNMELLNIPRSERKKYFVNLIYGAYIPFKEGDGPFYNLINELQSNRRFHKKLSGKGSPMEKIYKDLGNMLYGKIVCGISNKRNYSSRLEQMTSLKGNFLANPIIGTWITGFVRALLSELLYKAQKIGGKITAVTTDGFVCDIPDLENKIIKYDQENGIEDSFINNYRDTRILLSGDPEALEVKTNVRGLIQWTTRGQISVNHTDPSLNNYGVPIAAMTGFQKYHFPHEENLQNIKETLGRGNKLLYLSKRLSGALDSYKNKTHVSMLSHLAKFRTVFDSKRMVIDSENLRDTKPYLNIAEATYGRALMNSLRSGIYSAKLGVGILATSKSSIIETLKYFLRIVYKHFNYNLTEWNIEEIACLILPTISKKRILKYLAEIYLERGVALNKVNKFEENVKFAKNILTNIERCSNILNNSKFIESFKHAFAELL